MRARAGVLTMIAVGLPTLSGCGAGFNSAVDEIVPDNAAGQVNGILARALVLVKGQGAPSAALAGTLINRSNHDDVLTTITLTDDAAGSQSVSLAPNIALAAGQVLPLGAEQRPPITVPDARAINIGDFVNVVLHFQSAGDLRLQVAAAERKYFYADEVPTAPNAPTTQGAAPGAAAYNGTQIVTGQALSAKNPAAAAPATPKPTKAAPPPAAKPAATKAPAKAGTTPKAAPAQPASASARIQSLPAQPPAVAHPAQQPPVAHPAAAAQAAGTAPRATKPDGAAPRSN
jgi:hypothetical protein